MLDINPLESPYERIAADVNASGAITTLDLIEIQRLVLGDIDVFTNNTSWRFVPSTYDFPEPNNPWFEAFPESLDYENLMEPMYDQDFVAIKIGDVNGSAATDALASIEDREFEGTFAFEVTDQKLNLGSEYTIEFRAQNLEDIQGYQFTLGYDLGALEFVGLEFPDVPPASDFRCFCFH